MADANGQRGIVMNYLLRVLRITVCLYLSVITIPAVAEGTDTATREALLKKAWSCGPVLHEEEMYWTFSVSHPKTQLNEWMATFPNNLLEFHDCPDQDGNEEMRKAFIREYVEFGYEISEYAPYGPAKTKYVFQSYSELMRTREESGPRPDRIRASQGYKNEKSALRIKQEEQERLAAKENALKTRRASLSSGALPVASLDDAAILYEPKNIWGVMGSPLLMPNKSVYGGAVILDGQESENVLRAKFIFGYGYATLKLTKKTINYSKRDLRIGGSMDVIGRYVQNKNYTTVSGEGKTMPVIEVMYIGDADTIGPHGLIRE